MSMTVPQQLTASPNVTSARRSFGAVLAALLLLAGMAGCAFVPGDHAYTMREQSTVKLPVSSGGETAPANVKVQAITAQLIIEQEKTMLVAAAEATAAASAPATNGAARPTGPANNADRAPGADYTIGPGDVLNVTVFDHPELTIPAGSNRSAAEAGTLVAANGTIFYPYAGIIKVSDKTAGEVRAMLVQKLAKFVEKPQVDVRVISFRSKRVYVVGEVKTPGVIDVTDVPLTIVDAVNRAGGFTLNADLSQVLLTRDGQTWRVDVQALYENGDVSMNVPLRPSDIINVPDRQINKIFVLGEVQKPGSIFMPKKRMSLAEALADAGYINQQTANPHFIFVMRNQTDKPEIYHLDSKSPDALLLADRFPLQPRDIIYVDAADVARWNRVITSIQPTASLLSTFSGIRFPLFGARQSVNSVSSPTIINVPSP